MNGGEFLEPETMYSIVVWRYLVWYFLVLFSVNRWVYPLFGLFIVFFWLSYFSPKSFGFSWILLLLLFSCHLLLVEFSFVVFECSVLNIYCFILCRYLFNLLSFAITFWFISPSCAVIFSLLPFPFCSYIFQRLSFVFSFWPVLVIFFYLRFESNFLSWF